MNSNNRNLNIEKETKQARKSATDTTVKESEKVQKSLRSKKTDPSTGQTQYPGTMGHHGSDDEKNLNPEE